MPGPTALSASPSEEWMRSLDFLVADVLDRHVDPQRRRRVRLRPEGRADVAGGAAGVGAGQVFAGEGVDPARPGQHRQAQPRWVRPRLDLDPRHPAGAGDDRGRPQRVDVAGVAVGAGALVGRRQFDPAERAKDQRRLAAVGGVRRPCMVLPYQRAEAGAAIARISRRRGPGQGRSGADGARPHPTRVCAVGGGPPGSGRQPVLAVTADPWLEPSSSIALKMGRWALKQEAPPALLEQRQPPRSQ